MAKVKSVFVPNGSFEYRVRLVSFENKTFGRAGDYAGILREAVTTFDSDEKFRGLSFEKCTFYHFPQAEVLFKDKPKYDSLRLYDSKLTHITSLDLKGFGQLTFLDLSKNNIEELPDGLFVPTPHLRDIILDYNKISVIAENILEPLKYLVRFYIWDNPGISVCYNATQRQGFHSLHYLKSAISRCKSASQIWSIVYEERCKVSNQQREIEILKQKCSDQNMQIAELEKKLEKAEQRQVFFKFDFTVKIFGNKFAVQKELLIANSPLLAQMIHENEDADTLELKDISDDVFEEILSFMHSKQPPKETSNFMELYAASGRLQMKELMDLCAEKLMDKVTPANAFDILCLSKKFKSIELEKKAFDEVKKSYEK